MKATQATPIKLSRRSRSGRWEGALVFADEVGDGEEGLSPAPEGAAICCRVFMILSLRRYAQQQGKARDHAHARSWALTVWQELCGREEGGEGSVVRKARCGAPQQQNHMPALLQLQHKQGERRGGEAHTFESVGDSGHEKARHQVCTRVSRKRPCLWGTLRMNLCAPCGSRLVSRSTDSDILGADRCSRAPFQRRRVRASIGEQSCSRMGRLPLQQQRNPRHKGNR